MLDSTHSRAKPSPGKSGEFSLWHAHARAAGERDWPSYSRMAPFPCFPRRLVDCSPRRESPPRAESRRRVQERAFEAPQKGQWKHTRHRWETRAVMLVLRRLGWATASHRIAPHRTACMGWLFRYDPSFSLAGSPSFSGLAIVEHQTFHFLFCSAERSRAPVLGAETSDDSSSDGSACQSLLAWHICRLLLLFLLLPRRNHKPCSSLVLPWSRIWAPPSPHSCLLSPDSISSLWGIRTMYIPGAPPKRTDVGAKTHTWAGPNALDLPSSGRWSLG